MKARIYLATVAALAAVALIAPMAAAQAPQPVIRFTAEFAHPSTVVPENGRVDVPVVVRGTIGGTGCAQEATFTVKLKLDSFAKWAGSSMLPPDVTFKVPSGPYANPTNMPEQNVVLNLAWNVEDAPKKGAMQDYYVTPAEVVKNGGPCLPDPQAQYAKAGPMTATLPDRPEVVNATGAPDCATDPFQAACQTITSAPAESPGLDLAVVLIGLAGLVVIHRRRSA